MARLGQFDPLLVPIEWFDETAQPIAWVDRDLVPQFAVVVELRQGGDAPVAFFGIGEQPRNTYVAAKPWTLDIEFAEPSVAWVRERKTKAIGAGAAPKQTALPLTGRQAANIAATLGAQPAPTWVSARPAALEFEVHAARVHGASAACPAEVDSARVEQPTHAVHSRAASTDAPVIPPYSEPTERDRAVAEMRLGWRTAAVANRTRHRFKVAA